MLKRIGRGRSVIEVCLKNPLLIGEIFLRNQSAPIMELFRFISATSMDIITNDQFPTDLPWVEICTFFGSLILVISVFNSVVLSPDEERPVSLPRSNPRAMQVKWKGKVLDEPCIKVSQGFKSREVVHGRNSL